MLKLLICDDEESIRRGLARIIDWKAAGYEICGEAGNGDEALERIAALRPDLVLLDIKMPGRSGLDVLKAAAEMRKDEAEKTHFLILSGFSEFSFAQEAVNCGAEGYFVKPIDENLLEEKAREIAAKITRARAADETKYLPRKFERLFAGASVEEAFGADDTDGSIYQVALLCAVPAGFEKRLPEFEAKVAELMERDKMIFILQEDYIAAVFRDCSDSLIRNTLERFASRISDRPFIILGKAGSGAAGALASFLMCRRNMDRLFYTERAGAVDAADFPENQPRRERLRSLKEKIPELLFCIETYDFPGAEKIFCEYESQYVSDRNERTPPPASLCLPPPKEIKSELIAYIVELQSELLKKYPEREFPKKSAFELVPRIMETTRFRDACGIARQFTFDFIELYSQNTAASTVTKVIQYIKANYTENLKLEALGKKFYCNSAYLGKKFKETTGVQFNVYLDQIRIEEVKRLLSETDLKVYQISKLVGYSNTDYFFMKFKRYTGMTPKDYQAMLKSPKKFE